jgi:hypothetical protein
MDAHILRRFGIVLPLLLSAMGANYETANFAVDAPNAGLAQQFGNAAEQYRKDLAVLWLGKTLPDWSEKCPVKIHVGNDLGAGGATSFVFENGEVFGWEMEIQGSQQRVLDSVLPHEITHMVFATHFRRPIPRWLDEGAATSVECTSEKENYRKMLRRFLHPDVRKCFPLNRMAAMKEYPADPMPFYAQGFSVVEYLLEHGRQFDSEEHRRLVRFAQTAMQTGDWHSALQEHYGIKNLGALQLSWVKWVNMESPALQAAVDLPIREPKRQAADTPITLVSAKPLPPYGKSIYDRRTDPIPVQWSGEKPDLIPVSFGKETIVR